MIGSKKRQEVVTTYYQKERCSEWLINFDVKKHYRVDKIVLLDRELDEIPFDYVFIKRGQVKIKFKVVIGAVGSDFKWGPTEFDNCTVKIISYK